MKKKLTLALLASAAIFSASAESKIDPAGQLIMRQYENVRLNRTESEPVLSTRFDMETFSRADSRVTVYVRLSEGYSAADIEARGFDIVSDFDDIVLASGTFDDIKSLEECEFVTSISFGKKNVAMLDAARVSIGVDKIHAGTDGLNKAYTGKGVIAGIFDTGLDPNHANFLNEDGSPRIKSLWHMNGSSGSSVVYDTPEKIQNFTTDSKEELHGTHTLGCMAGSFKGEGNGTVAYYDEVNKKAKNSTKMANPYYGIAIGADIAAACGELYDGNITKSVENIVNYAKKQGKPLVVNLSLGNSIGPHDGTEEVAATLDKLANDAIICVSSGNEGARNISIDKTFTSSDNSVSTFMVTSNNTNFDGMFDIWSDTSDGFDITVFVYDTSANKVVYEYKMDKTVKRSASIATSDVSSSLYEHSEEFDKAFTNKSFITMMPYEWKAGNNRYNNYISFNITYNSTSNISKNLVLGFKIEGTAGQRLMATCFSYTNSALELSSLGRAGFADGTPDVTANSIACGQNVISVGSYNSRTEWPVTVSKLSARMDNSGLNVDDVSYFTSYAKLIDGRTVPFICGPGCEIISSVSKYSASGTFSANQNFNGRENHWQAQRGTSMSSPVVAGAICLWLEANPYLTAQDVRDIIKNHASKPGNPAQNPVQWGYGKFDALAGLKYVIDNLGGVNDVTIESEDKFILTPESDNNWEVYVPKAESVSVSLYNVAGQLVKTVAVEGSELDLSTDDLAKGVYVLNINGSMSARIAVR